jgi:hypothetical protein
MLLAACTCGRAFSAGKDCAIDAVWVPAHGGECEMSAVADGPEADLVDAESFSQVLEIVGAFARVTN